jgi:hypothetical protein
MEKSDALQPPSDPFAIVYSPSSSPVPRFRARNRKRHRSRPRRGGCDVPASFYGRGLSHALNEIDGVVPPATRASRT